MRIDVEQDFEALVARVAPPDSRPAQEEALLRRIAVDLLRGCLRILFQRCLQGVVGDRQSAQVGNVLAERELAVDVLAGQRFVGVELFDEDGRASLEGLLVLVGPPVGVVADGVELAALIVEAVAGFVADDAADTAVVDRIVGLGIEERRLQDRCREVDRVVGRVVIGIDRLRRHAPVLAVGRLADLGDVVVVVELHCRGDVVEVAVAGHAQPGPVTPLFRVADLGQEARPLFERLGAGGVAHPRQVLDAGFQRRLHVVDQFLRASLRFRREGLGHVEFAESHAELVVDRAQNPLPARLVFRLAVQCLLVEGEVCFLVRRGQVGRGAVGEVIAQVGLPVGDRRLGQHLVDFSEELRLRQREAVGDVGLLRGKECVPVEMRSDLVGFLDADEVVLVLRIAQFGRQQGCLGQPGLEREDGLGLLLRFIRFDANQFEHLAHMGDIGVTQGGMFLVLVVVGRRQTEAALEGVGDLALRILEIGFRTECEKGSESARGAVVEVVEYVAGRCDGIDLRKLRLDRIMAELVDGGFVHAVAVEGADLLLDASRSGVRGGRGFDDLLLRIQARFAQLVECTPARAVCRNRVCRDPFRVDEAVEIGAGVDAGVEIADVEGDVP